MTKLVRFVNGDLLEIAKPICDKVWPNCAFYNTSVIFVPNFMLVS